MARLLAEIEASIDTEVAKHSELDAVQNNSSFFSFFSFIRKVVAFIVFQLELIFDAHKEEIEEIINVTEPGNLLWYKSIVLEYQHGDALIIENNLHTYNTIDLTSRIVKKVSVVEVEINNRMTLVFRTAKEVNGVFVKMNETEVAGLSSYLHERKFAGTRIDVQSNDPDELYLSFNAILDPILFNDSGELLEGSGKPIPIAIESYLKEVDTADTFYLSSLIKLVLNIPGVIDFRITNSKLNNVVFSNSTELNSAFMVLDQTSIQSYVLS